MAAIEDILKTISTANFSGTTGAGRMNATQATRFIDYIVDQSQLIKDCNLMRMVADRQDIDYIGIGSRIMRKGVEATAPADVAGVTHTRRQIGVTEVILPFDLSFNYLEDNIEGDNIKDHLMRLFALQYANDMEDLAINGLGTGEDPFLSIVAGWVALIKDANHTGVHKVDIAATDKDFVASVFPKLIAAMPDKWKRNVNNLAIYLSPADKEKYRLSLINRNTSLGDSALVSEIDPTFLGYKVKSIPTLGTGEYIFGNPKNLTMGIHARDMRIGQQVQERKRLVEVTITSRVGFEITSDDQLVYGYDMP